LVGVYVERLTVWGAAVFGLFELGVMLAVTAAVSFVLTLNTPTRSWLRQGVMLVSYAIIFAGCVLYLAEHQGLTQVLDPAWRDYVIVGVLGFIGAGVMVMTFDLFINFDTLKEDPQYAMLGRSGLAFGMVCSAVFAMTAVSIAWYQVDPTIFEARSNTVFWLTAGEGGTIGMGDLFAFALDQTQKALLFDVSEVYRVGLIDISNNPQHLSFSTACLVYRTYLSVFVITIAIRLVR
jgi:hypothetical protein